MNENLAIEQNFVNTCNKCYYYNNIMHTCRLYNTTVNEYGVCRNYKHRNRKGGKLK